MMSIGPFFGKSSAFCSKSTPGCKIVPPQDCYDTTMVNVFFFHTIFRALLFIANLRRLSVHRREFFSAPLVLGCVSHALVTALATP
jgi:hypothetical protein